MKRDGKNLQGIFPAGILRRSLPILFIMSQLLHPAGQVGTLRADTIVLRNGTRLVGRIIGRTKTEIIVKNDFGSFKVPLSTVKTIVPDPGRAGKKEERRLGPGKKDGDEKGPAGREDPGDRKEAERGKEPEKGKESPEGKPGKTDTLHDAGSRYLSLKRIHAAPGYMVTVNKLKKAVPRGAGLFTGADFSLEDPLRIGDLRLPALRAEVPFFYFWKGGVHVAGAGLMAGPCYAILIPFGGGISLDAAVTAGVSALDIRGRTFREREITFTAAGTLGVEKDFDSFFIFCRMRCLFIYDVKVPLRALGVETGAGTRL